MKTKIVKIITSKWTRLGFSTLLIYAAFARIDTGKMIEELSKVRWEAVVGIFVLAGLMISLGSWRWSILVLGKPRLIDVMRFTRSSFIGSFYNLFFPSAVGGDLLKWIPLLKHYPELTKTKMATSVLLDRIVGFTAFAMVALISLIIGKIAGYEFPETLLLFFVAVNMGIIGFYLMVFLIDVEKILSKYKKLAKIEEIVSIVKKGNRERIVKCLIFSLFTEPLWIGGSYLNFLVFGVDIRLMDVFIFTPIISLLLVLPISVAGFGARENLFLYFFSQAGVEPEMALAVSAFTGIIGVLCSLFGGLLLIIF